MADVTSKVERLNGVNSDANYVHTDAYRLPLKDLGINGSGTHQFATIPEGRAIVGAKMVVLASNAGGTVTLKAKNGSAEVAIGSALSSAAAVNTVTNQLAGGVVYYPQGETTLEITNSAELTAGEIVVMVDSIPVKKFLTNG